jgi:3-deoxy-manno-octulosonate cytidylyltransferase (CMP-KDO synthetase)
MKIIGIIPARYASSRFPGKPLADICGKPMIIRVYEQVSMSKTLTEVIVATDDNRIVSVCAELGIKAITTDKEIAFMTERVYAASKILQADAYYCIPGDEPLVSPTTIDDVVKVYSANPTYDVVHAVGDITDATEVIDYTNLKIVSTENNECIYISRSPIPYPKGTLEFNYRKLVCGCVFSKNGLDFFHKTPKGTLENAEDCDIVRFIEHRRKVLLVPIKEKTLSVDTPKDLERVCTLWRNTT